MSSAKVIITIHNLRFQGIYGEKDIKYWSGLPEYLFNHDVLLQDHGNANLFKGGLAYSDMITTVSNTYAAEIQTPFFGENLDGHLRYHSGKLRGIVNGIDCDLWDSSTDDLLKLGFTVINEIPGLFLIMKHPSASTCLLLSSSDEYKCGQLVKDHAQKFNGRGGGRPDNARAIFPSTSDMDAFIREISSQN